MTRACNQLRDYAEGLYVCRISGLLVTPGSRCSAAPMVGKESCFGDVPERRCETCAFWGTCEWEWSGGGRDCRSWRTPPV